MNMARMQVTTMEVEGEVEEVEVEDHHILHHLHLHVIIDGAWTVTPRGGVAGVGVNADALGYEMIGFNNYN